VFKNDAGKLRETTAELGLGGYTGLWQGVTTGDLDGDGSLDIVAANWGLNSPTAPLRKDRSGCSMVTSRSGTMDLIETEYDSVSGALVPRRQRHARRLSPFLREQFQVTGIQRSAARGGVATAKTRQTGGRDPLVTTVFVNRGARFEAVELLA
jgi:hypothetical protein